MWPIAFALFTSSAHAAPCEGNLTAVQVKNCILAELAQQENFNTTMRNLFFDLRDRVLALERNEAARGAQLAALDARIRTLEDHVVIDASAQTVTLRSPGALTMIGEDGQVLLTGSDDVVVDATRDVQITGVDVDLDALASLSAVGTSSATLQSSAVTTMRGALNQVDAGQTVMPADLVGPWGSLAVLAQRVAILEAAP